MDVREHLIVGVQEDNIEMVKELITKDASLANVATDFNRTALMLACLYRHVEVVRYLVEVGANFDIQDNIGKTALHYASSNIPNIWNIRILLDNGADPAILAHKCGKSSIHFAHDKKVIYELIANGDK